MPMLEEIEPLLINFDKRNEEKQTTFDYCPFFYLANDLLSIRYGYKNN